MKLSRDQKQRFVQVIKKEVEDIFNAPAKIKITDCTAILIKFGTECPHDDADQLIDCFNAYVSNCAKSFAKWPEASLHNWLGYLRRDTRMKEYVHKLKTAPKEIAGKKESDSWAF